MEKILIVILEACDFKSCEVHTMNEFYVKSDGKLVGYDAKTVYGVSPCVSLAPGTEISSGDGTANSPYIVDWLF